MEPPATTSHTLAQPCGGSQKLHASCACKILENQASQSQNKNIPQAQCCVFYPCCIHLPIPSQGQQQHPPAGSELHQLPRQGNASAVGSGMCLDPAVITRVCSPNNIQEAGVLGHLLGLFLFPVEIPVLLPHPMASSRGMNGVVEGLSSRSGSR